MTPLFLPHTALDRIHELGPAGKRLSHLQSLRDQAIERGAHVVLLIRPTLDWVMLAIEFPAKGLPKGKPLFVCAESAIPWRPLYVFVSSPMRCGT